MKPSERAKLLAVHSIGPKMVSLIEQAGFKALQDFAGRSAADVAFQIEIETGVRLNRNGIKALQNVVDSAER